MTAPKLRFKEFSEDYNFSKFQEASIQIIDGDRGNNYPKSDDFYDYEYCLFLNAGNVTKSGFKFESTQFINKEKDALLRKGKLQKNDLVITTRGTVGNIAYFDESIPFENIRINSGMVIVRSEIDLEPIYLNQFLKSDLFEKWLEKNVFGSAQPQLTVKLLNSISISYPSKEEQTKIASFLSAADEKISQLNQKHVLLNQYKQGMMQKLFSQQIRFKADDGSEFGEWTENKFGECINVFDNLRKPISALERIAGNTPYYGANGIQSYIDGYTHDGEFILIAEDGANDLINYPIQYVNGKIWVNNHAHVVSGHHEKIQNNFLKYRLKSLDFTKYLVGGGRAKLNAGAMKEISFSAPCLEEQTKIANFLSAIDQKIEVVAQQIEQAKQWKKGLLQQMFV